jgi:hypothetical protein
VTAQQQQAMKQAQQLARKAVPAQALQRQLLQVLLRGGL